jgi:hypothetical protein
MGLGVILRCDSVQINNYALFNQLICECEMPDCVTDKAEILVKITHGME